MTNPEKLNEEQTLENELSAARFRTFQLEKTIKWWSECTASWRERWGRVRSQRNKLREDISIVSGQYKSLTVEYAKMKSDRDTLKLELDSIRPEKQVARVMPFENTGRKFEDIVMDITPHKKISLASLSVNSEISVSGSKFSGSSDVIDSDVLDGIDHLFFVEDIDNLQGFILSAGSEDRSEVSTERKISNELICDKLEKVKKYIRSCQKYLENKNKEIQAMKLQKEDVEKKLHSLQEKSKEELKDQPPASTTPEPLRSLSRNASTEMTMKDLHAEIERLQEENCTEWTKREQCETNMADAKRELNSANQRIKELEEELAKKHENVSKAQAMNIQMLNEALDEKSKTLLQTKASLSKTRKQLQEKVDALTHEKKRTEQYDGELKKLRARIDMLKKQVVTAEETVDNQNNQTRRLQRSVDELTQTNDTLQAQLTHVNTRLKRELVKSNCDDASTTSS